MHIKPCTQLNHTDIVIRFWLYAPFTTDCRYPVCCVWIARVDRFICAFRRLLCRLASHGFVAVSHVYTRVLYNIPTMSSRQISCQKYFGARYRREHDQNTCTQQFWPYYFWIIRLVCNQLRCVSVCAEFVDNLGDHSRSVCLYFHKKKIQLILSY